MKKPILLVALVAVFLASCARPRPQIEVASSHDLGIITKGERAVVELPVRNLGVGPLIVEGLSTSCGCTTARMSSQNIPAGGEAILHVEYDSALHAEDMGPMERFVFIASNDPERSDVGVRLTVVVERADGEGDS